MKAPVNAVKYYEDHLVRRFAYKGQMRGLITSHGKRVGKDCPLTRQEIRTYVEQGAVKTVALIRSSRQITLREALDLLNQARGTTRHFHS